MYTKTKLTAYIDDVWIAGNSQFQWKKYSVTKITQIWLIKGEHQNYTYQLYWWCANWGWLKISIKEVQCGERISQQNSVQESTLEVNLLAVLMTCVICGWLAISVEEVQCDKRTIQQIID